MKLLIIAQFWDTCVERESPFELLSDLNIFPTGALIQGGALNRIPRVLIHAIGILLN